MAQLLLERDNNRSQILPAEQNGYGKNINYWTKDRIKKFTDQ
jgi:hypothetical protein